MWPVMQHSNRLPAMQDTISEGHAGALDHHPRFLRRSFLGPVPPSLAGPLRACLRPVQCWRMYREPAATPATAKAARAPRNICTSISDRLEAQCESFHVIMKACRGSNVTQIWRECE